MSSAAIPPTSIPKRSRASSSLSPPRLTKGEGAGDLEARSFVEELAGLDDRPARARDEPGHDQGLGLLEARREAPPDQQFIRAFSHRRRSRGAPGRGP